MISRQELDSLLKAQREAYNDTISHLMENFESRLTKSNSEFNELKVNFEALKSEFASQTSLIVELRAEIASVKTPLTETTTAQKASAERLDYLEDQSRRNNLRIDGIKEEQGETWEHVAEKVKALVKNKIGIQGEIPIERAHRVGKPSGDRPRSIVARFLSFTDKNNILRNAKKLKGSNLYINEDLCETSRNKRKEQLPQLKQARSEGKIAYFVHTRLVIKERNTLQSPQDSSTQPPSTDPALLAGGSNDRPTNPTLPTRGRRGGRK